MTWKLVHISVLQSLLSQETDKQAVAKLKQDYMDLLVISTMPEQKRLASRWKARTRPHSTWKLAKIFPGPTLDIDKTHAI